MKQEIQWNRLIVEGIVIVGSILLAFAIDAGWQVRSERVQERDALQSLRDEFEVNLEAISDSIERHGRMVASAERILEMSFGNIPVPENVRQDIRSTFFSYRSTNNAGGTLTALLSSGEISVIRNPELRRKIAAWPSILEDATEEEQVVVRIREQIFIPFVARRLHLMLVAEDTGRMDEALSQFKALLGDDELESVVKLSAMLKLGAQEPLVLASNYLRELIELIAAEERK